MPDDTEPDRFYSVVCVQCSPHAMFDTMAAFIDHGIERHGFTRPVKGIKQTICHLDAQNWYEWQYRWIVNGVAAAVETVRNPRKGSWG